MPSPLDLAALATAADVPLPIAEHYAPLLALLSALQPAPASAAAIPGAEFDLHRSYTAAEAAVILGLSKEVVYNIPKGELPRVEVGPARGGYRWVGIDLLCYRHKLSPVDWTAVRDAAEQRLLDGTGTRPKVKRMPGATGKSRVH